MAKHTKGICPICGMKNCTCDHTTKAVPALMGDPRPHRKPASVFKDAVGNRDGSSIAAEGMSAANYSMHKRGAKMRKDSGGGDYVEPKYIEDGGGKSGKGGYAGQPNAGVPPMYPKGITYTPPPRVPFKPDTGSATVTASGGGKSGVGNMPGPTPSSKLPPNAPSPEPKKKTTKMAKNTNSTGMQKDDHPEKRHRAGHKKMAMSKAMPMPMTSAMPSISPRPMPPKILPYRPATTTPPMASGSGLSPMTKGAKKGQRFPEYTRIDDPIKPVKTGGKENRRKFDYPVGINNGTLKVSKAATMPERINREVGLMNDFLAGTNYRGIPSTGRTVMSESNAGTPGWKVKYTEAPDSKPGSYTGTKGAKKMAKADGQGAYINGKPAPQSHSLSKIAKSASSGQGAYINGRPAQTTKRSK